MKSIKSLLIATLSIAAMFASTVKADEVCRTVTHYYNVYAGYASCSTYSTDLNRWVTISEYVNPTQNPTVYLTDWVDGVYISCSASVPYSHTSSYDTQECEEETFFDASFIVKQDSVNNLGYNNVVITSTSTEKNWTPIVSYKWWIDGEVAPVTKNQFGISTIDGKYVDIKLEVTDADGSVDSMTQTVYLRPWNCNRRTGDCGSTTRGR